MRPHRTDASAGLLVGSGARLEGRHVLLADDGAAGALVGGGTLALTDAQVRDNGLVAASLNAGLIVAGARGTLEATRVLVEHNGGSGVSVEGDGARAAVTDCVVRGTQPLGVDTGDGLAAARGGTLSATRVLVEDNPHNVAVAGATLALDDSLVRAGQPIANDACLLVGVGGHAVVQRSVLTGCPAAALTLTDDSSSLIVADSRIDGRSVLEANDANSAELLRSTLTFSAHGVSAGFAGCVVTLTGCALASRAAAGVEPLSALQSYRGGVIAASGLWIRGPMGAAASAVDADSRVELGDSLVDGQATPRVGTFEFGLLAIERGLVRARGLALVNTSEVGALAIADGTIELAGVVIEHVAPWARRFGAGLYAGGGGAIHASQTAVLDAYGLGAAAAPDLNTDLESRPGTLELEDFYLRGVRTSAVQFLRGEPGESVPDERPVAYGLYSGPGCTVRARRAALVDGGYGFFVARGGLELHQVLVTGQLDATGAVNAASGMPPVLDGLVASGNARDEVLTDVSLPEAAALPLPTALCAMSGCQ